MLKLAILHGATLIDGEDKDGEISFITTDTEEQHMVTLVSYLKNHYKDDPRIQSVKVTNMIESVATLFTYRGDILFIDTTRHPNDPQRIKQSGSLICPTNITEKQKTAIKQIETLVTTYPYIDVEYDTINQNGFPKSKVISGMGSTAFSIYLNLLEQRDQEALAKTKK